MLLLAASQCSLAGTQNNKRLISDFTELLSISGDFLVLRVPKNMVFQESASSIDSGGYNASVLVFESDTKFTNKMSYQHESVNAMSRSGYIDQIEKELRSQFYSVKTHGSKTKRLRGRAGTYHIQRVTFSYYDGQQPKAVTVVAIHDGKQMVTVAAEAHHTSIKKAVAKSKQLAKNALSVQKVSKGSSSILYYLGVGVVVVATIAIFSLKAKGAATTGGPGYWFGLEPL